MDIARINDRDVLISGMTDMRDFAPQLKGYYDKELHMLIVEPQYAGMYNGAYATLGFSNGLSIFWGDAGMAVGYIGDTLYWASSPYSPEEVNSYMFLLFSTPPGVEFELPAPVRRFENLLVPQDEAPPAGVRTDRCPHRGIADRKHRDRRTALHDLPDGRTRRRSGESLRKHGGESPAEGKRLRTDLVLHTR